MRRDRDAETESDRLSRAVVTGGAGFIGSVLVDRLLDLGWEVTVLDAFHDFYSPLRKRQNLARASTFGRFHLAEADVRVSCHAGPAIVDAAPDIVFDLAALAGVRPSIKDPMAYVDTNVVGLQNTLQAVARAGARLVFASSSSVYGSDPRQPFTEEQANGRPLSPYGATKVAGEALVHAHHQVTGLPVAVARLFTVYGPRQRPDLAIHHFGRRILAGKPIELYDEGRGIRDYTYVDDVVDALVLMARTHEPFLTANIGSHHPVSTLEVVQLLEEALQTRAERRLVERQLGDVPATFADITRARTVLGWEPRTSIQEGIARFCRWLVVDSGGEV
jgi:UDP-glucuronate 4-epimerase